MVEEEDVPPKLESSSKDSPLGLPWEDVERVGSHARKYLHPYKKLWDHKTWIAQKAMKKPTWSWPKGKL